MNDSLKKKLEKLKQTEKKAIESMTPEKHEDMIRKLHEAGILVDSGWSYEDHWRAWKEKTPDKLKASMILSAQTGQKELMWMYRRSDAPLSKLMLTPRGYKSVYINDMNVSRQQQFEETLARINTLNKELSTKKYANQLEKERKEAEKEELQDKLESTLKHGVTVKDVQITETLHETDYDRLERGLQSFINWDKAKNMDDWTDEQLKADILNKLGAYLTHISVKLDEFMSGDDIDKFWNFAVYEGTETESGSEEVNSKFKFMLKGVSINFTDYLNQMKKLEVERKVDMDIVYNKLIRLDENIRKCSREKVMGKFGDTLVNKYLVEEVKDRVRGIQQEIKRIKTLVFDLELYAKD